MALSLSRQYSFSPSTTIASAEVNTNENALYNAFSGLEGATASMSKLPLDADPASALHAATKQYVDHYAAWRRPMLTFVGVTTVDVEVNTDTSNKTSILFPDGSFLSVTEDTSSANKYRRFDITAAANFTSGTEDSGLRSGITEAVNTWYAIYAVKSQINTANFVLVGDTTLPTQANVGTLNGRYTMNSWVYLGLIRNGDNGGSTGDILNFTMCGNMTIFRNTLASNQFDLGESGFGMKLTNTGSATSLTYSYSTGTGATNIPNNIREASYLIEKGNVNSPFRILDESGARLYRYSSVSAREIVLLPFMSALEGLQTTLGSASAMTIVLSGFIDGVLGVGSNPLI